MTSTTLKKVQEKVDGWLSEKTSRNIAMLARSSGIAESTLRRMLQSDAVPYIDNVLPVLKVVATREETIAIIRELSPVIAELMEKNSEMRKNEYPPEKIQTMREFVSTPLSLTILTLATSRKGTTRAKIERLYGARGIRWLEKMLDTGVLKEDSGKVRGTSDFFAFYDSETITQEIAAFANGFNHSDLQKKRCMLSVHTESVSDDGIAKLLEAAKRFAKDVEDIIEKNPGDMTIFATSMVGTVGEDL